MAAHGGDRLFERARRLHDDDIALLLLMSLETLFVDARSELGRRLAQRCALFNGRDRDERKALFSRAEALYDRRSRLVQPSDSHPAELQNAPDGLRPRVILSVGPHSTG
ncbi:MAG: hypothetical protein HYU25_13505 [Candidatus Rokubacteria bacterium]|nr:hypothetical protein [Candidatus Rokubacteria bacterium]